MTFWDSWDPQQGNISRIPMHHGSFRETTLRVYFYKSPRESTHQGKVMRMAAHRLSIIISFDKQSF
jgi:hypothetical protein